MYDVLTYRDFAQQVNVILGLDRVYCRRRPRLQNAFGGHVRDLTNVPNSSV
jgi:hypothetical protein